MTEYKSYRLIDGEAKWVIVDENDNIINKIPNKEELKKLKPFPKEKYNSPKRYRPKYTDEELLDELRKFEKKEERIPTAADFRNNADYPSYKTYQIRFGSWNKALEKAFNIKRNIYERKREEKYTDEELLDYLTLFEKENGRPPTIEDFINNHKYPGQSTYKRRFGRWINALKLAGLCIDLMGPQGNNYRARLAEIKVINHFKRHSIDLAGENRNSPCDGICPNGQTYDVKSSKLHKDIFYLFNVINKYKEDIEIFYLLAFNEDYTKLEHVWRIPGEIVEKNRFIIGLSIGYEFNIENMKEYDITYKFKDIFNELL